LETCVKEYRYYRKRRVKISFRFYKQIKFKGEKTIIELIDILEKWIRDYCKRHRYIILEIDWNKKLVFYYLEGKNLFEDYSDFNYLKVDLFK
jgi:hypothetical protein